MSTAVRSRDDVGAEAVRLAPARRRFHLPTLLSGVLLIIGCALAFGVLAQQLADRRPVLVLARPADRGTVLTDADVAVAQVSADAGAQLTAAEDRGRLVGRTLLTSLPAGSFLTESLVGPGAIDIGPSTRTIGLALEPGEYPVASLAPGDTVGLVATTGNGSLLDDGTVVAVRPLAEAATTLLVSVVVDAAVAAQVTAAAAQDEIRLVLHGVGQ